MRADRVVMVAVRLLTFLFIGAAIGVFIKDGQWGMVMLCSALFFATTYAFAMLEKIYDEVMKR